MMKTLRLPLLLAAIGLGAFQAPAVVRDQGREQQEALRGLQQGRIMPLRVIENRIVPKMRGFDYLGPELDVAAGRYRLKFIRGARVIWIDVDARTGQVIGQSGN
jgi:uncharacterized membrane protein YkoI